MNLDRVSVESSVNCGILPMCCIITTRGDKAHLNTMTYILYIIHNLLDRV